MQAARLLAQNVMGLLTERHLNQTDLAKWCHRSDPWVSQFLRGERNWQLDDLDKVADLFGLQTWQLFQPGISSASERRRSDRRSGRERRRGHAQRQAVDLSASIEPFRKSPGGKGSHVAAPPPHLTEIHRILEDAERKVSAVISLATPGGQAPAPRKRLPPPPKGS